MTYRRSTESFRPLLLSALLAAASGCGPSDGPGSEPTDQAESALRACFVPPACDAAPPPVGKGTGFSNLGSTIKSRLGTPGHRVRDLLLAPGQDQWVLGTVVYESLGFINYFLERESVDVYVLRNCGAAWERLGTATTTKDKEHATVEGFVDGGGRVYFQVPPSRALGEGRHRVRLVVKGDATAAEGFIEVQPKESPFFVSDVDGTLTTSEAAEFGAVLTNTTPEANPGAAAAYRQLAAAGYRPVYLTARTETELNRTRVFLQTRGFPPGTVRTTQGTGLIGLSGSAAVNYKAGEIALLQGHGFSAVLGVGNTDTDAQAYRQASLAQSFMFLTDAGATSGARRFDDYTKLLGLVSLPPVCR